MWTSHGHQIIGTIAEDPVLANKPQSARCGGPGMCKTCDSEASKARQALGLDEFGRPTMPLVGESSSVGEMLGRARLALILLGRPESEVEAISQKLAEIIAERNVLMETPRAAPKGEYVRPTPDENPTQPSEPGFYYNVGANQTMVYILSSSGQWSVVGDSGTVAECVWGYIEQTLGVFPLRRLDRYTTDG